MQKKTVEFLRGFQGEFQRIQQQSYQGILECQQDIPKSDKVHGNLRGPASFLRGGGLRGVPLDCHEKCLPNLGKLLYKKDVRYTTSIMFVTCEKGWGIKLWVNDCWIFFVQAEVIPQTHKTTSTSLYMAQLTSKDQNGCWLIFCLRTPIIPFILGGSMVLGHTQGGKWRDSRLPLFSSATKIQLLSQDAAQTKTPNELSRLSR